METRSFKGIDKAVSLLGFGLMRLPTRSSDKKDIDLETGRRMVDMAIAAGVNYFDTAWVYHEGASESFAGEVLSGFPRDSYHLATKMPPWVLSSKEDLERIFTEQLRKCRVEHFDFYLLHNIGGKTYNTVLEYNVYEFLRKKKEAGYIRYLGFSVHDTTAHVARIVNEWEWDFGQLQVNYVDWEDIDAKGQYTLLAERGIPVVVMEPLRGGALADLPEAAANMLKRADAEASQASWALRYAASLPGVLTVLSGMSTLGQMEDNLRTMTRFRPLSETERALLAEVATIYRSSGTIPCTGCRYCMDCPTGVDIPRVFSLYNHYRKVHSSNPDLAEIVLSNTYYRALNKRERAESCIACGKCVPLCPQGIDIPKTMKEIVDLKNG
ncbi:aldo/keto reductase [Aminiphilus circumscriptus]|jgi:predicted aldo/keto reductase-like oxidoreductase|uniref:aldo/keto reductase n=1 Tax=Aminiphilus circumscriptus TaxID=290732 RepID=UPI0004785F52|nr:aldo/keto reductase [Aminiphilus circumscriptus]